MAFLYKQPKSPFWWIRYRDEMGKIRRESTKYRIGIGLDTSQARQYCAKKTVVEMQIKPGQTPEIFGRWVLPFIEETYADREKTRIKYLSCWSALSTFFQQKGIDRPSQIQREHALEYLTWRQNSKTKGVRAVTRNSALLDLRILRIIMFEAYNRDYIAKNPISKLGLEPDTPKRVQELTDQDIERVRELLKTKPEWMRICFEIALYQGCRPSETCLPLSAVNLQRREITFRLKGGKMHTTILHPKLLPLMKRLKKEGREYTYPRPLNLTREWSRFFRKKKHGFQDLSFRSTRVTAISRLARANVNEQKAMRFIGHANWEIHQIYQRVKVSDLDDCLDALDIPKPSEKSDLH